MAIMKLVNGLPTSVAAYDESISYPTGLAATTPITLPNSGSFLDSAAKDLQVIYNDLNMMVGASADFTVVGAGPTYTQIQFNFALPNNAIVRFKQNL